MPGVRVQGGCPSPTGVYSDHGSRPMGRTDSAAGGFVYYLCGDSFEITMTTFAFLSVSYFLYDLL